MDDRCPPIAITMGDPAGIGGEISLKAWATSLRSNSIPFFLIDDPNRLEMLATDLSLNIPIETITRPDQAHEIFSNALPVLEETLPEMIIPGTPNAAFASTIVRSIDRALELVLSGNASAMVTNPIHKSTLYDAGFAHPGHTEYLAAQTEAECEPVMMLVSPSVRVVPVTIHLSLRDAIEALSIERIMQCATTTAAALRNDFAINQPRIAIAGLNPHAGEDGHLGREEIEIISPAIDQLKSAGLYVDGPFPSDSLFHEAARRHYDVVICMYHDQALIPSKTLDFDSGVNVTLGLPVVRTSPDHGTAFDIAGTGKANPGSLIAAITIAEQLATARQNTLNGGSIV
ncbi:MAG: 4-hydroxythreonine-4-phosphate dehydrogenase PdxA [Alphaproteobacteria bacterium]|nr:4-hydroxythreonine-4-phosphate dehydrogenase PdxA [Alphaproteobacteria bacterium]